LPSRCNKPPFDDVRIRQAACHAIDRQQILALMGDAAQASSCYVSPMKWGFTDIPGYPEFNPELSQKLLADAGFPGGKSLPPAGTHHVDRVLCEDQGIWRAHRRDARRAGLRCEAFRPRTRRM